MFESDLWSKEQPAKGEMFIWAYYDDGKWKTGLAYWTVTDGQWRDAYDWNGQAHKKATHFHPMPRPPQI